MLSQQTPLSSFPLIEDCIGEESCVDLMPLPVRSSEAGDHVVAMESRRRRRRTQQNEMKESSKEKEYPPLIPLLARTENLHPHMPWVLNRTYTDDGRLILREEPVRHHEYFQAYRRDGRLTLQLVPLDDEVFQLEDEIESETDCASPQIIDEGNGDDHLQCSEADSGNRKDSDQPRDDDTTKGGEPIPNDEEPVMAAAAAAEIGKCLNVFDISGEVNLNGGSSRLLGLAVPELGPVRG